MARPNPELEASSSVPRIYSTYICREPVGDIGLLIHNGPDEYTSLLRTLQRSADHWAEKDHPRTVERLQLEIGRLHMQNKQWQRAMRTLLPLWQSLTWRQAGWWNMLQEVDWALKECAKSVRDAETLIAVEWELTNRSLTKRQESRVDFRHALEGLEKAYPKPRSVVKLENIFSCVSATFAFSHTEGNVGVPLESQLVLFSCAHAGTAPIELAQIKISFEGGLKNVDIHHRPMPSNGEERSPGLVHVQQISLRGSSAEVDNVPDTPASAPPQTLSASADLTLAAGETSVISFWHLPRNDGDVQIRTITAYIKEKDFDLELVITGDRELHQSSFWASEDSNVIKKPVKAERSSAVKILPKPPRLRIALPDILTSYYVDEDAILNLEVMNEEDEPAQGTLDVRILGPPGMQAKIAWTSESEGNNPLEETTLEAVSEDGHKRLPTRQLAMMDSSTRQRHQLHIRAATEPAEYSLRIEACYNLLSDPETPISKVFSADVAFIQPFEATFNFAPRMHPEPWPNYFDINDAEDGQQDGDRPRANGLSQRWSLASRITSLATDTLIIESISPKVGRMIPPGTATCHIFHPNSDTTNTPDCPLDAISIAAPGALQYHAHTIDIQKLDLEDRHSFSLELYLRLQYRRKSAPSRTTAAETTITTILAIPPLPLPFSEPRCLAWTPKSSPSAGLPISSPIPLTYTLENPSSYTLTFSLSMDNNEAFAFSGPKSLTIQLLPLSRRNVEYRLLPLDLSAEGHQKGEEGGRWIWPHCVVVDTGFRKTLRILPAAEGMRGGRRGEIGLWAGG